MRIGFIEDQNRARKPKARIIDDYKESGLGNLPDSMETGVRYKLDIVIALSTYYRLAAPRLQLHAIVVNYTRDYIHIAVA